MLAFGGRGSIGDSKDTTVELGLLGITAPEEAWRLKLRTLMINGFKRDGALPAFDVDLFFLTHTDDCLIPYVCC